MLQSRENVSVSGMRSLIRDLSFVFEPVQLNYKCSKCVECNMCRQSSAFTRMSRREHEEDFLVNKSITYVPKDKRYHGGLVFLPTRNPLECLTSNYDEAAGILRKTLLQLQRSPNPADVPSCKGSFDQLVNRGTFKRFDTFSLEDQRTIDENPVQYHLCIALAFKSSSKSTPLRICFNASKKTKPPAPGMASLSLNDCLAKGRLDLDLTNIVMGFRRRSVAIVADISKFYNSLKYTIQSYPYQNVLFIDDMNPAGLITRYICTEAIYGIKCVSAQTEAMVKDIAERHKDELEFSRLVRSRYVDDLSSSTDTMGQARELIKVTNRIFEDYHLKIKGWILSGEEPPENMAEGGVCAVAGYLYKPVLDIIQIRLAEFQFETIGKSRGRVQASHFFTGSTLEELEAFTPENITLRMVTSRMQQIFDPAGLCSATRPAVKSLLRRTTSYVRMTELSEEEVWNYPLSQELRKEWVQYFYDQICLSQIKYPRFNIQYEIEPETARLVAFADASFLCSQQVVYIGYRIKGSDKYDYQLLSAKNQINPENSRNISDLELNALTVGAGLLHQAKLKDERVKETFLFTDSQIVCWMLRKDTITLAQFQRNRVNEILRLVDSLDCIYHVRSSHNAADVGTRVQRDRLASAQPDSVFHRGPEFIRDIPMAVKNGIIKPIKDIEISSTLRAKGRGILPGAARMPAEYLDEISEGAQIVGIVSEQFNTGLRRSRRIQGLPPLLSQEEASSSKVVSEYDVEIGSVDEQQHGQCEGFPSDRGVPSTEETGGTDSSPVLNLSTPESTEEISHSIESVLIVEEILDSILWTCVGDIDISISSLLSEQQHLSKSYGTSPYNVKETEKRFRLHSSPYIINPIKYGWKASICIMSHILLVTSNWVKRVTKGTGPRLVLSYNDVSNLFRGFYTERCMFGSGEGLDRGKPGAVAFRSVDEMIHFRLLAVQYFMEKASCEALYFIPQKQLKKHSYLKDGLLFAQTRIPYNIEMQNLTELSLSPHDLGYQAKIFLLDKFSPVTISLVLYYHHHASYHGGIEATRLRLFQSAVIFRGRHVVTQIVSSCTYCKIKNKKMFRSSLGPMTEKLIFSPVNYHVALDMAGPFFIQGYNFKKGKAVLAGQKVWILVTVCVMSGYVSVELMQNCTANEFSNAFTRIASILAYPAKVFMDNSSTQLRSLLGHNFSTGSIVESLFHRHLIVVQTTGTGSASHYRNGLVERKIRSLRDYLRRYKSDISRASFTEFSTILKLACSQLNSAPLALKQRHSRNLKAEFISANSFLTGLRDSTRAPTLAPLEGRHSTLENISKMAQGLSTFFRQFMGNFLLKQKWNVSEPDEITTGDLVLFQYNNSNLDISWKLGLVRECHTDSDSQTRIITILYSNGSEISYPSLTSTDRVRVVKHLTKKATNKIVKIYTISDQRTECDLRSLASL